MKPIPAVYVQDLWAKCKSLFSHSYRASWYYQSFIY